MRMRPRAGSSVVERPKALGPYVFAPGEAEAQVVFGVRVLLRHAGMPGRASAVGGRGPLVPPAPSARARGAGDQETFKDA